MGGRKEILGAALLAIRALVANPIDDVAALTILATTHQVEAKAAFFDSQRISLRRPEEVKRPTNGNGKGELPTKGDIFPDPGKGRNNNFSPVLSNKPQVTPLRL